MKHLIIPEPLRAQYKSAAAYVWNYIAGDCPEAERYSVRTIVEIVRDANRISDAHRMGCRSTAEFQAWIKEHEYDQAYRRDMDRAVREVI